MLKINQIRCEVGETFSIHHIAKKLRCSIRDIHSFEIDRESIDARGDDLHYSYSVYASIKNEDKYLKNRDVKKRIERSLYSSNNHKVSNTKTYYRWIWTKRNVCRSYLSRSRTKSNHY